MIIENGKITIASEKELYNHYFDCELYELYSFTEYKRKLKERGAIIYNGTNINYELLAQINGDLLNSLENIYNEEEFFE